MTNNEIFKGIDVLTKLLAHYKEIKIPIIYDKSQFKNPDEECLFVKNITENSSAVGYPAEGKGIQNFVTQNKHYLSIPCAAEKKILELISKIKTDKP